MKFLWTTASKNALEEIKEQIIEKYKNKDLSKIKIKFTKKKEFVAVPISILLYPAFNLYINEKLYKTYAFKNKKWKEI